MNTKTLFSSASSEWSTPQDFFDKLHKEFQFNLDPCSTHENTKCRFHFTREEDGLKQIWNGSVFMNPPYGRGEINKWMRKAWESSLRGTTVVCLVPARTCTAWWWDYAMKGEIRFIRGRLTFGGAKNCAPFPSALVIFRPPSLDDTQYCAGCEALARQVEDLKAQLAAVNDAGPCGCEIYETCERCRS